MASELEDHIVTEVCRHVAELTLARAGASVRSPDRYREVVAASTRTRETDRILRWQREFDVRPLDMANAIMDNRVPQWWLGQRRDNEPPEHMVRTAEVLSIEDERRRRRG